VVETQSLYPTPHHARPYDHANSAPPKTNAVSVRKSVSRAYLWLRPDVERALQGQPEHPARRVLRLVSRDHGAVHDRGHQRLPPPARRGVASLNFLTRTGVT
jgi:hypothetical protein